MFQEKNPHEPQVTLFTLLHRKILQGKHFLLQNNNVVFSSAVLDELQAYKGSRVVGGGLNQDSWGQGCAWWRDMDGEHQRWQACLPD
jgi:hypothetical protein